MNVRINPLARPYGGRLGTLVRAVCYRFSDRVELEVRPEPNRASPPPLRIYAPKDITPLTPEAHAMIIAALTEQAQYRDILS